MEEEKSSNSMLDHGPTSCRIQQQRPRPSLTSPPKTNPCIHAVRFITPAMKAALALLVILVVCLKEHVVTGTVFQSIQPGGRLSASNRDVLVSRDGRFTLGFFPNDQNQVYFGIWFTGGQGYFIISKVVWVANRNTPGLNTSYAELALNGVLNLITNGNSYKPSWNRGNTSAVMGELLDSGNFILKGAANTSVWESFNEPTDTLLPDQVFREGSQLLSWSDGGNSPLQGMYSFFFQLDSNLVLYASNQVSYWSTETEGQRFAAYSPYAFLDDVGYFNIVHIYGISGFYNKTYQSSQLLGVPGPMRRLTLDYDGNLRMYVVDTSFRWIEVWAAVSSLNCIPNVNLSTASSCNQGAPGPAPSASRSPSTAGDSRNGLLIVVGCVSIFAVVAVISSSILYCFLRKKGYFWPAKSSSSGAADSKVSANSLDSAKPDSSGFFKVEISNSVYESGTPPQRFSFAEIQEATRNFSKKLGSGGFGDVYKGKLPNKQLIAVKRLDGSQQGDHQFQTEVLTIGSVFHPNLVRLYGYCSEDRYRMLVYEFVANRSLERFIFSDSTAEGSILDWPTRLSIALGTAKGLQQCHELQGGRPRIIHCDVKPENILLDSEFRVKVSDFGLAKIMGIDKSWTRTHLRGTRGYLAPEWLAGRIVSVKVDVFSFGVVLLEIISGSRCCDKTRSDFDYMMWVYNEVLLGMVANVVDKKLKSYDEKQVLSALRCALWCVQEKEHMRPSMGMVVDMLEGKHPVSPPPPPRDLPKDACNL